MFGIGAKRGEEEPLNQGCSTQQEEWVGEEAVRDQINLMNDIEDEVAPSIPQYIPEELTESEMMEMVGEMAGVVDRVEVTQGVGVNASTPVEDTVVVPPTTV